MGGNGTMAYNNLKQVDTMEPCHGSIQQQTLDTSPKKVAYEEFLQFVATTSPRYKSFTNLCTVKTYDTL